MYIVHCRLNSHPLTLPNRLCHGTPCKDRVFLMYTALSLTIHSFRAAIFMLYTALFLSVMLIPCCHLPVVHCFIPIRILIPCCYLPVILSFLPVRYAHSLLPSSCCYPQSLQSASCLMQGPSRTLHLLQSFIPQFLSPQSEVSRVHGGLSISSSNARGIQGPWRLSITLSHPTVY